MKNNPLTKGVRPFSRDRLHMLPRDVAARGAMVLLNAIQDEPPEVAMASVAVLFACWCARVGMDPHDAHSLGVRMMRPERFHRKADIQMEVLRDFAGLRLVGDNRVDAN